MKEKKQELLGAAASLNGSCLMGGIGMMKLSSNNTSSSTNNNNVNAGSTPPHHHHPITTSTSNNPSTPARRLTRHPSSQGLSLVLEHRSLSPVRAFSPPRTLEYPTSSGSSDRDLTSDSMEH